ncbi:MAG: lysostaphin resistance A-like protein [Flavobacteriales bacterium]
MKTPNIRHLNPMLQMFVLFGLIFITLFLVMLLGKLIADWGYGINLLDPDFAKDPSAEGVTAVQRWLMVLNQLGFFLIPALLFGQMMYSGEQSYFPLRKPNLMQFGLAIVLVFAMQAPIDFLLRLNSSLPLGDEVMSDINEMEVKAAFMIKQLIGEGSFADVAIAMIVLAIIPAIAEEFFFRGVLLQTFRASFRSAHLAIWMTAIVFSFIHMQFLGFIPRMLLGALLGYIMVWSGSIWLSIIVHFFNNALGVFLLFQFDDEVITNPQQAETNWLMLAVGSLFTIGTIYFFHRFRLNEQSDQEPFNTFE